MRNEVRRMKSCSTLCLCAFAPLCLQVCTSASLQVKNITLIFKKGKKQNKLPTHRFFGKLKQSLK